VSDIDTQYTPLSWYWLVGGDQTQAYSSAAAAYVSADDATYRQFVSAGNMATVIGSEAELWDVLRAADVPPYHSVSTYRIVRRLEDAGQIDAADAALSQNKSLWRRFYTVGMVPADDPNALALLKAVGADPLVIPAPE
jgi:hypothetical protein